MQYSREGGEKNCKYLVLSEKENSALPSKERRQPSHPLHPQRGCFPAIFLSFSNHVNYRVTKVSYKNNCPRFPLIPKGVAYAQAN